MLRPRQERGAALREQRTGDLLPERFDVGAASSTWRRTVVPSSSAISPSHRHSPPAGVTCAPTGRSQPPPNAARNARSPSTVSATCCVLNGREERAGRVVILTALHGKCTLRDLRHELGRREGLGDEVGELQSLQRRDRHDDRTTDGHLRQPRLDVAAQLGELEIGPGVGELRRAGARHRWRPSRRGRAHRSASPTRQSRGSPRSGTAAIVRPGAGSREDPSRSGRRSRHRRRGPRPAPPSRTHPGRRARGSGDRAPGRPASRRTRARRRCRGPLRRKQSGDVLGLPPGEGTSPRGRPQPHGLTGPRARTGRAEPRTAAHPERCPRLP